LGLAVPRRVGKHVFLGVLVQAAGGAIGPRPWSSRWAKPDRQFIKRVVAAVEEGLLSESLVRALFTRARRENARYPMPYFIVLLRKIAAEKEIDI
jgi:hypothetical protein